MSELGELSVAELQARRRRLVRALADLELYLPGTLQRQQRRCGRPGCRCQRGELHGPYTYLAVRIGGRGRLLYLPQALVEPVRRRLELSTRLEGALREFGAINLELLARRTLD
jgi:hypothetical protein